MHGVTHNWKASPSPLVALNEPAAWLGSSVLHVTVGLLLGVIFTHILRHCHLRWTWAPAVLVVLLPERALLGSWTWSCELASVFATVRARHWHNEDLAAGGDLAAIAAARRGPLAISTRAARALVANLCAGSPTSALSDGRVAIGRTEQGRIVSIPFAAADGGRHTLVVGATGSGKTVTQSWIASRAVEAGLGAIVIDPKGDERMRATLARAAERVRRPFVEWTPAGPAIYNPFGHGTASEIADKVLAGERFTEPHYQRQAQRYIGRAVKALRAAGAEVSLPVLVEHLDPACLEQLAKDLPDPEREATYGYLDSLSARQRAELGGVRDRLAIMAESDAARWLDPRDRSRPAFELPSAIREGAVVYFALSADSLPLLARMVGVAIVQDLQSTLATLHHTPAPTVVVIDEFAAIAAEQVAHLFARARSAGLNLLLGAQELADLRLAGHPQLLEQVLGNLSTLLVHRQVVPSSAELIERLSGSRGAWRTSQSSNGHWSRSRVSVPKLAREQVRELSPGCVAAIELGGNTTPQLLQVFSSLEHA